MDAFDRELDVRLSALAERAPAGSSPTIRLHPRRHHTGLSVSLPLAGVLAALGIVATAAAGAVVVSGLVQGTPGIENEGQPLHGANLECMTPPQAAAFLTAHGYTRVVWQVEAGDGSKTGNMSVQQPTPPEHGFVVPGSIVDGQLVMVVDQRVGAEGVGACHGMPMP